MPELINPLRYPGSKRSLVNYIDELLTSNQLQNSCFYEPYAGSAAVGLELLQRQRIKKLIISEKDILIYAFWKCVFEETNALCNRIMKTPITVETWKNTSILRKVTSVEDADLLDLGFAGLFLNRTNFSGILNANPIGGINQTSIYDIACRFNKNRIVDIISKISTYRDVVEVHYGDALKFMASQTKRFTRETSFAYFDPPYYNKGSQLYRHFYTDKDHIALSHFVQNVKHLDWIISYDDAPFISNLYNRIGAKYQPFYLDYTCASKVRTRGRELLISNLPLPPFPVAKTIDL